MTFDVMEYTAFTACNPDQPTTKIRKLHGRSTQKFHWEPTSGLCVGGSKTQNILPIHWRMCSLIISIFFKCPLFHPENVAVNDNTYLPCSCFPIRLPRSRFTDSLLHQNDNKSTEPAQITVSGNYFLDESTTKNCRRTKFPRQFKCAVSDKSKNPVLKVENRENPGNCSWVF